MDAPTLPVGPDGVPSVWMPTAYLRGKRVLRGFLLEQAWHNTETGAWEWRAVPIATDVPDTP